MMVVSQMRITNMALLGGDWCMRYVTWEMCKCHISKGSKVAIQIEI